ncbi:MAG TPA: DUF3110 domain-containing protein [Nodosilinea sp.]|nr:DUF3110 domain-containing protein [Nodosilinea sp.]
MVVYVLLFNARTDNEGIHTLSIDGQDLVLMFEQEDDATRYALLLEAQDFPEATVEGLEQEEVEEFCASAGYGCRLIPEGALAVPPEQAVEQTTWSPDQQPGLSPEPEETLPSTDELDRLRQQLEKLL